MTASPSLRDLLRIAWGALRANRGRSVLTVLSITIGAFTIVVMSSLAASGLATLERGIEELGGARLILVVAKQPERGEAKVAAYSRGISLSDRERLFADLPHVEGLSLFSRLRKKDVVSRTGVVTSASFIAADQHFFGAFRMRMARGRAFSDEENRGGATVCVVGHKVEEALGMDLLGDRVTVGSLRCLVIGVLADNERTGVGFGFDWTNLVVAPSETVAALDGAVRERAALLVRTDGPHANEAVKRLINARLVARHPGVDDFTIIDFSGVMARFRTVFLAMELIVALLASVGLVIGGVGVMNMMWVSVSERVAEIGIRKALGAPSRAIQTQFLAEAVLLASAGGAIGVVSGWLIGMAGSRLIAHFLKSWQMAFAPWSAVAALAVSLVIGAVFGWAPAKSAAKLDPIVALRR